MKFKFRYESLLSYREYLKEKAAVEFARAQSVIRSIDEKIAEYSKEVIRSNDEMEKNMRNTVSSNEILNHSEFINALLIRIEMKKIERIQAENKLAVKRKDLLDRTRQCKVFEKLKEKDLEKWRHEQNQLELKVIDEAAVVRHGKSFL